MTGHFDTTLTEYKHAVLEFKFALAVLNTKGRDTGHGVYKFRGSGKNKVWNFDGESYEDQDQDRFYVYGERLKDFIPSRTEYRNMGLPANRHLVIRKFIDAKKSRFMVNVSGAE